MNESSVLSSSLKNKERCSELDRSSRFLDMDVWIISSKVSLELDGLRCEVSVWLIREIVEFGE